MRPQLFCLPHAGGSSAGFAPWSRHVASHVRVRPVELPGRGTRWDEPPPDRLATLVVDLATRIRAEADGPYLLYGHSFGALLAYELAHALRPSLGEPAALLVSGRNGPGVSHPSIPLYGLPRDRLLEQLRELDGVPIALLDKPDLIDPFLPVLRADARLAELYRRGRHPVLSCPVRALAGESDPLVDPAGLHRWSEETTADCLVEIVPAGHMLASRPAFLAWLRRTLNALTAEA
ncbi:thioesterase II family protein [Streptomyces olivochromogenes]|uniref:thioesterase II family protein n=1 Tax=Streptomyces olivochromogenes TaxID=1963 RepID=UPI001F2F3064|nr:alpha/beta fold hydrolase [Streptomyces olivochromogenes]MCF3131678.1 thioesterase [Streptomyces olivochromogenes]